MWYDVHVESLLNIRRSSRNLATMWITEKKNSFLREFRQDNFYSLRTWKWTVLYPAISSQLPFFGNKAGRVFVPKFFHEKRARNFLNILNLLENMGLIMFDVNNQKLEENITSIISQLIHQQNQF